MAHENQPQGSIGFAGHGYMPVQLHQLLSNLCRRGHRQGHNIHNRLYYRLDAHLFRSCQQVGRQIHAVVHHLLEALPAQMHHHRIGGRGGSPAPGAGKGSLPGPGEIMGLRLQSAQALLTPKEQSAGGNGAQAHLMGIDGDGRDCRQGEIPFELPFQERQNKAAEGGVDMHMNAPFPGHPGQILNGIHLAELSGPGYAHQGHRFLIQ